MIPPKPDVQRHPLPLFQRPLERGRVKTLRIREKKRASENENCLGVPVFFLLLDCVTKRRSVVKDDDETNQRKKLCRDVRQGRVLKRRWLISFSLSFSLPLSLSLSLFLSFSWIFFHVEYKSRWNTFSLNSVHIKKSINLN